MDVPTWLAVIGYVVGTAGTFGTAFAVLRSRYRKQTDQEREKYIEALEARNALLEQMTEKQSQQIEGLKSKHDRLAGRVQVLQDLVLRNCRRAEIDPETGGCRHCSYGMAYGQGGNEG